MPDVSKQQPKSEYQRVKDLMRELGSPSGFDPLPPDQHRWMMDPDVPPLQRMWGWMIGHTVHWGHRSAFAIDKATGRALDIENMAEDLGMDGDNLPNCYRVWRRGVARGIWRNGAPSEGVRRLYLTGKVPKFKGEEPANSIVCTDNFPTYILKQIQDLDADAQTSIRLSLDGELELQGHVQAALIAANRAVFMQRQDNILREHGIEPAHQEHRKKHETEEDAEARRQRIEPIRTPIEQYVQTIQDFVQSAPKPPLETTASLLHAESKNQRSTGRSASTVGHARAGRTQEGEKSKPLKQQYTLQPVEPLTPEEKLAGELIFLEIRYLQRHERYKHMEFSREVISESRRSDQLFVFRVLSAVGPKNVKEFLQAVSQQLERLDRNALGKLPGKAPAPRSLGLILQWAIEFGEGLTERAALEAEEEKRLLDRGIRCCQEILNDPAETADAKYEARKWLEAHALKESQTA